MPGFKRPSKDLTIPEIRALLAKLRQDKAEFKTWTRSEINQLADLVIPLTFKPLQLLTRKGEIVEWVGLVTEGSARVESTNVQFSKLGPGEFIGYMKVLELDDNQQHRFDVVAETSGSIALIYLEDFKQCFRRMPRLAFKLLNTFGQLAMQTVHLQHTGRAMALQFTLQPREIAQSDLFAMLSFHTDLRNLVLDRLEWSERTTFISLCELIPFKADQPIVEKGFMEDTFFVLLKGELYELQNYESKILPEGKLLGIDHFIAPGRVWPYSIFGWSEGYLLAIRRDSFNDIISENPLFSVKLFKLLFQMYSLTITMNKQPNVHISEKVNPGSFIELDVRRFLHERIKRRPSHVILESEEEPEQKTTKNYPPLFLSSYFQQAQLSPLKKNDQTMENSQFLQEKLKKQRIEARKGKNIGIKPVSPPRRRKGEKLTPQQEIDAKARKVMKMKKDHELIRKQIEDLEKHNKELEALIKQETIERDTLDLRFKRLEVFKEIQQVGQQVSIQKHFQTSFRAVALVQLEANREFYLAQKYTRRWQLFVEKKRKFRKTSIKS